MVSTTWGSMADANKAAAAKKATSGGGFSQSGAQISADVSEQKDVQRYKSTGSKGGNTPSYVSQGGGGGSRELTSTGYKSTGSGRSGGGSTVPYQSTGANRDPAASGYQRYGSTGGAGGNTTNVNLGFANVANTTGGLKAIADRLLPVARNLLGMVGSERSGEQSQALASNQLRSGTATPDWDRIYPGYQNIPAPDPYYVAPDAMTVALTPPVAERNFDTPLTAGAPDWTPKRTPVQGRIIWPGWGAMGQAVGVGSGIGLALGAATAPDPIADGTLTDEQWRDGLPIPTHYGDQNAGYSAEPGVAASPRMDAAAVNETVADAVRDLGGPNYAAQQKDVPVIDEEMARELEAWGRSQSEADALFGAGKGMRGSEVPVVPQQGNPQGRTPFFLNPWGQNQKGMPRIDFQTMDHTPEYMKGMEGYFPGSGPHLAEGTEYGTPKAIETPADAAARMVANMGKQGTTPPPYDPDAPVLDMRAAPASGTTNAVETYAEAAARMKANMGKQGTTPPPYDPNAPVLDMRAPAPDPLPASFYPDVATGGLGFGPGVTGDPNEVAPYYASSGPSEGMFTKNVGGVDSATLFSKLEADYGLPRGYMNVMWKTESAQGGDMGDPENAYGHFQFIPSTADAMGLALGDRTDLTASATAAAQYAVKNMAVLEAVLGRPPTGAELYLAHQQGSTGGPSLLANPSRLAKDVVPRKNLPQNILGSSGLNVDTMTAGQFADMWGNKYATYDQALNGVLSTENPTPGGMVNPAPGQFISPQGSGGLSFGIPEADLATSMVRGYPVGNASGGTPAAPASGAPAAPSVAGEFRDSYEARRDIPWWANTIAGAVNPLFGLAGRGINAMGGIPLGDPNNPAERYVSSAQRPNGDSRLRVDEGQNQDPDPDATDIPADAPPWWPPGLPWPPVSPTTGPVVPPYVPTPTVPAPPTPYYFSYPTVSAAGAAGLAGMPGAPWQ